jgi:hypothetical protein
MRQLIKMMPRRSYQNVADAAASERLVDEVVERYVDWREASAAADHAYVQWSNAPASGREGTFAAYAVALDQEEMAAGLYRTVLERLRKLFPHGRYDWHSAGHEPPIQTS